MLMASVTKLLRSVSLRSLVILFFVYLGMVYVLWKYWESSGSIESIRPAKYPHPEFNRDDPISTLIYSILSKTDRKSFVSSKVLENDRLPRIKRDLKLAVIEGSVPLKTFMSKSGFSKFQNFKTVRDIGDNWTSFSSVVVLFESCEEVTVRPTSFNNVYHQIEDVVQCSKYISSLIPNALIAWYSKPLNIDDDLSATDARELETLWQHLILTHLVTDNGLLVFTESSSLRVSLADQVFLQLYTVLEKLGDEDGTAGGHERLVKHQKALLQKEFDPMHSLHSQCDFLLFTRRYNARCHPPHARSHAVLVTGLGGSGTHHVARSLNGEGWRVRHEEIAADGAVSWFYAVNDRAVGLPYPYGGLPHETSGILYPRFEYVIHLVRHPEAHISSFTAHSNKSYDFVLKTMQVVLPRMPLLNSTAIVKQFEQARAVQQFCFRGDSCHLEFAALTWLHWNLIAEKQADITFRVEDTDSLLKHVCELASQPSGSLLLSKKRFCEVSNCPAVLRAMQEAQLGDMAHRIKSYMFKFVDTLFDVCGINEALFKRAAVHKRHLAYTLVDVQRKDGKLASQIQRAAMKYGWSVA